MATTGTTYVCAKCRHTEYETDEFRATGGNFAKDFRRAEQEVHHGVVQAVWIH